MTKNKKNEAILMMAAGAIMEEMISTSVEIISYQFFVTTSQAAYVACLVVVIKTSGGTTRCLFTLEKKGGLVEYDLSWVKRTRISHLGGIYEAKEARLLSEYRLRKKRIVEARK